MRFDESGLQMRFESLKGEEIKGIWLDGPERAELDKLGFLTFPAAGLVPREPTKKGH